MEDSGLPHRKMVDIHTISLEEEVVWMEVGKDIWEINLAPCPDTLEEQAGEWVIDHSSQKL